MKEVATKRTGIPHTCCFECGRRNMEQNREGRGLCVNNSTFQRVLGLAVFLVTVSQGNGYECGGFVSLDASVSGTIQSPGYPGNYPNYTRCIWILEAPSEHVAKLTVTFEGEQYNSACSDYVEFRDGGASGDVIQTSCGTLTSSIVTSTGRWMFVFFSSDGFSQQNGLSATYTASFVGASVNSSISDPIKNCKTFEFECANKICLSQSYRCDGFYDCGCGEDCDEDGCGGLVISKQEVLAIGFCMGIVVFILSAVFGRSMEKHHNWEKERGQNGIEITDRRQGWSSTKRETPKPGLTTQPQPPRKASCTIKISEIS